MVHLRSSIWLHVAVVLWTELWLPTPNAQCWNPNTQHLKCDMELDPFLNFFQKERNLEHGFNILSLRLLGTRRDLQQSEQPKVKFTRFLLKSTSITITTTRDVFSRYFISKCSHLVPFSRVLCPSGSLSFALPHSLWRAVLTLFGSLALAKYGSSGFHHLPLKTYHSIFLKIIIDFLRVILVVAVEVFFYSPQNVIITKCFKILTNLILDKTFCYFD